jgi:intracellular sulfur oxidation DsrE/DsrF family protein
MLRIGLVTAFVGALVLGPSTSFAFDDSAALQGITEGKIAFDITDGGGKLLLKRLDIIDETRRSLIQQGVNPHFVIAFRGPATRLVQTEIDKIAPEDREAARAIAAKIDAMSKESGVDGMEQCSVAAHEQGIKPDKVMPAIKVVGNGFISLMAYQARGYAYIRP